MRQIDPKHVRILAIATSTRGFGYAVLENQKSLVDWGVKSVRGDKNAGTLAGVKRLIGQYCPDMLVTEDVAAKGSRRSLRIRKLGREIGLVAKKLKLKTRLISRGKVMRVVLGDENGTRHALAEILAQRFPEELASHLPPKRRAWMSEDSRMDIFDAVALVVTCR